MGGARRGVVEQRGGAGLGATSGPPVVLAQLVMTFGALDYVFPESVAVHDFVCKFRELVLQCLQ